MMDVEYLFADLGVGNLLGMKKGEVVFEVRKDVGSMCCGGNLSWKDGGCIYCCCCGMLGIICNTTSFIVGSITIWNEEKCWLKFSVIVRLF